MRKKSSKNINHQDIPAKANRILNIILVFLVLIAVRCWHLAIVEHNKYFENSKKPQKRVVIEPAIRGTIRDRFNIPLAINKIQYNASIIYSQLQVIPSVIWVKGADGKKIKYLKRREYIKQLSHLLAEILNLDAERVEDLIHSKASFYGHLPYIIHENLTEKQYYRLKMLEKDWAGLHLQILPQRVYPKGKVGCDVIGYMGSISKDQYNKIMREIVTLKEFISLTEVGLDPPLPDGIHDLEDARQRYLDLQEKTYSINDYVGKAGIESFFEETLRGFYGKKIFFSDARGNFLKELPGSRKPLPGQRILLSLSSELQEYAEELLVQNEKLRKVRVSSKKMTEEDKEPWIKGGAIVMMDPSNGDVLCLASYPRFDPNDFISTGSPEQKKKKSDSIKKWLESEAYVADLWHRKRDLEREVFNPNKGIVEIETQEVTWENYLKFILPKKSSIIKVLDQVGTVKKAIELQRNMDLLMRFGGYRNAYGVLNELYSDGIHKKHGKAMRAADREDLEENLVRYKNDIKLIQQKIHPYFQQLPLNFDKVFLVDLCRIVVSDDKLSPELIEAIGDQRISDYHKVNMNYVKIEEIVEEMAKELFHMTTFKEWKEKNQNTFLKEKRIEEKEKKLYAKPYIDYFDAQEKKLFSMFWNKHKHHLILTFLTGYTPFNDREELQPYLAYYLTWQNELSKGAHPGVEWKKAYETVKNRIIKLSPELGLEYLASFRRYEELDRELLGKYKNIKSDERVQYEKNLAGAFYPRYGYSYNRSYAYRNGTVQGSTFKLVVAYEALLQKFNALKGIVKNQEDLNPFTIEDRIFRQGKEIFYGRTHEGVPIPSFYKGGRMIKSMTPNFGEVDITKALEVSSNPYFSLLAGDFIKSPNDLERACKDFSYGKKTGIHLPLESTGKIPEDLAYNRAGLYATAIGQHSLLVTPLQTAVMMTALANGGKVFVPKIISMIAGQKPNRNNDHQATEKEISNSIELFPTEIANEVFLPDGVRNVLFDGMEKFIKRVYKTGIWSLATMYNKCPEAISDLLDMEGQIIGKSSTGEIIETIDLDLETGTNMYNHVWLASIVFDETNAKTFVSGDSKKKPEVVIVVFLRYGSYGKDATPIAAQMAKKWRQIKKKYDLNRSSL